MGMPKATMYKDRHPARPKNDVGVTRQILGMKRVAVTKPVKRLANPYLRCGILSPDASHQAPARACCLGAGGQGISMLGPTILVNTLTQGTRRGTSDRVWQYHGRSDSHSKVACWTVLFDLLRECDIFRRHAVEGKIGFAVNHILAGKLPKALDLVICRVPTTRGPGERRTFGQLVKPYGIQLDSRGLAALAELPVLDEERPSDVSQVLIALESKACMTEHSKSLPRLFAEILAAGYLAKRSTDNPIVACYAVVNAADSFVTPSGSGKLNRHQQPHDAKIVVDMIGNAIPTVDGFAFGYDTVGIVVVNCQNDGTPVTLINHSPAPGVSDSHNYERMIRALCSKYGSRFGNTL